MSRTSEALASVDELVSAAQAIGPRDSLTLLAYTSHSVVRALLIIPFIVLIPPVTFILGLLVSLSFGLLLIPFSLLWILFFGLLLGSSWLWVNIPITRPILLPFGVVLATIADWYVSLIPDMGEKYQKVLKMAYCDSWPYSYLIFQVQRSQAMTATQGLEEDIVYASDVHVAEEVADRSGVGFSNDTRFCTSCGKEIQSQDANFCGYCGAAREHPERQLETEPRPPQLLGENYLNTAYSQAWNTIAGGEIDHVLRASLYSGVLAAKQVLVDVPKITELWGDGSQARQRGCLKCGHPLTHLPSSKIS